MSAVSFSVDLAEVTHHLVHVTMEFVAPRDNPLVQMASWCPGSYLIRDYARHVRNVTATAFGEPVPMVKTDKATWQLVVPAGAKVMVRYSVYGHELTVRTNHIDASHAFLHGPATFMYLPAARQTPIAVNVVNAPPTFTLETGLTKMGPWQLSAASVDELLDGPLHCGVQETFAFSAKGTPFRLACWGARPVGGKYHVTDLVRDLERIVTAHMERMGDVPFSEYTFVVLFSPDAYGGLEHGNSSINLIGTTALATQKSYEHLLELLSHEFFHAWNGKRMAPAALHAFDYTKEAYTRCLWVMEGMTSHYDRWSLQTARVISTKSYLEKVLDDWTRLLAIPGRRLQSLEASSFDAWIKLYKPDETNLNTTVSYYLKGGLALLAMDLEIRRRTENERSLDDALRFLWQTYGAKGRPYPEDVQADVSAAVGLDLSACFARTIQGTDDPLLPDELAHLGLELFAHPGEGAGLGVSVSAGKITGVFDDSAAAKAGLSPGDELVALDGFRIHGASDAELRTLLGMRKQGETVDLAFFRRGRLLSQPVVLEAAGPAKFEIKTGIATPAQAAAFARIFGENHAAGDVLATVATASRQL